MARFNDAYLTDAGADLIAQSITDGVKIEFVRMEIGDGEYTEEEKSKDVLRKRTTLKNKRQESSFNSVEKAKDSAVKLKAAIDNRSITTGYRMTEIGIFAKASGDTASDGVLYSIAVAVEADYMPPESTPITYIQEFYTKVGNAENVEITVSTGVYALAEDLAEVEEPTYTESEELEELTPGENLKLALGKLAKAVKEIIAHMALKATGNVAGHVKVSSSAAVTDSTGMALAATEKNASLEGTLAYKLEQLNTNLMRYEQFTVRKASQDESVTIRQVDCFAYGRLITICFSAIATIDIPAGNVWAYLPDKFAPSTEKNGGMISIYNMTAGRTRSICIDDTNNEDNKNVAIRQTIASNVPAGTIVDFFITYYQD